MQVDFRYLVFLNPFAKNDTIYMYVKDLIMLAKRTVNAGTV